MSVYYNEIDKRKAEKLRWLIAQDLIAAGDVDERSIVDVQPNDLRGYTQCHFFAGIGGWSLALRSAMWPDDRPVWTGSCPCTDYSTIGKQSRQLGKHHFWPDWFRLIKESNPSTILGEQVASAIAAGWLDEVFLNLEAEENACAAAILPSYSVQADNERMRIYWVAHSTKESGIHEPEFKKTAPGLHNHLPAWRADPWDEAEPKVYSIHDGLPSYVCEFEDFGDAIHVGVATEFIKAYRECVE